MITVKDFQKRGFGKGEKTFKRINFEWSHEFCLGTQTLYYIEEDSGGEIEELGKFSEIEELLTVVEVLSRMTEEELIDSHTVFPNMR